jgi:formylglycine-generating enzyme required for sulfatase activity
MGSPGGEPGRKPKETRHWVTIGAGFLLGATAVTQGQWQKVMGVNPSFFKNCGVDCPVESVSWFEAVDFCNRLSDLEGLSRCYSGAGDAVQWDRTCQGYRLPTEAEWEYAARAGSATPLYSGPLTIRADNDGPELDPISWYGGNSAVRYAGGVDCSGWKGKQYPSSTCGTHPVAGKRKNGWGLYDMQGNVWQWVWDWEGEYPADPVLDPAGPDRPNHGARRADRGGSWDCYARFCRSANRDFTVPGLNHYSLGFRLARSLPK